MTKPFPIRIRTFLVPLLGVALYFFAQFIALFLTKFIHFSVSLADIQSQYLGTVMILTVILAGLFLAGWFFIDKKFMKDAIRRDIAQRRQFLYIIPLAFAMLGIVSVYMLGVNFLANSLAGLQSLYKDYVDTMNSFKSPIVTEQILYYVSVGLFVPIIEELIFRGAILSEFRATMKPAVAVFLSALIFAVMHGQPIQIGYALLCGIILGTVYVVTNSIYFSIGMHIIFNLLGGVLPGLFPDRTGLFVWLGYLELLSIVAAFFISHSLWESYKRKKL